MDLTEKTVSSKEIFDGRVFKIKVDTVMLPDGRTSTREIVSHNGGVAVIAVEDDCVYLVRQFRKAIEKTILEIPAGKIEPGEEPSECGKRELEEEIGLKADSLIPLGKIYPTPGYCSETIYLFLAEKFQKTVQKLDDGEFLNVEKIRINEVFEMIKNGEICDGKTVAGIYKAISFLK